VLVLQCGCHSFLIRQLLIDRLFGGVSSGCNLHGDLEAGWQRTEQLHPDGQANQSGHRAMRNRWGEADVHGILGIANAD